MKFDASKIQTAFVSYELSNLSFNDTNKQETDPVTDVLKWLAEEIKCPECKGAGEVEEGHFHSGHILNSNLPECKKCHFCNHSGKVQRVFALMQKEDA